MKYLNLYAKKLRFLLIFAAILFFSMNSEAWHGHVGGVHGGYYNHGGYYHHGYYGGGYYGPGFVGPGVYIGVPGGMYYGNCSYVQRCYSNGCVNQRVCY